MTYNQQYLEMVNYIQGHGFDEKNIRTGHVCKSVPGYSLNIDCSGWKLPILGVRRMSPKTFLAEAFWILSGEQKIDTLRNNFV